MQRTNGAKLIISITIQLWYYSTWAKSRRNCKNLSVQSMVLCERSSRKPNAPSNFSQFPTAFFDFTQRRGGRFCKLNSQTHVKLTTNHWRSSSLSFCLILFWKGGQPFSLSL
jgi:hypothetical protein